MFFRTAALAAAGLMAGSGLCEAAETASPVVVELFTSQGCSSCPDADALVSGWGAAGFKNGTVIPLTYDVDYWNYLGWKDVFSTPVYSRRQRDYAAALKVGVYTPQLVAAGRAAFVGSDGEKAEEAVRRFSAEAPAARVSIASSASPRVKLTVAVQPLRERTGDLRVMLALFENGLVTKVLAGENQGRALRNDFVVRRLVDLGRLPAGGKEFRRFVDDSWDPAWRKDRGGAAVFIQDAETLAVYDAGSLYPFGR